MFSLSLCLFFSVCSLHKESKNDVPKPPSCGWRSRLDMHRGKREEEELSFSFSQANDVVTRERSERKLVRKT